MSMTIDSRFLSVIVHDLRTPLNVITLSLRMIEQQLPAETPEVSEDVRVIHANVFQIDGMLALLADYCRLLENRASSNRLGFNPSRLVAEEVEFRADQSGRGRDAIRFESRSRPPSEVNLDEPRARLAIRHALSNAMASATGAPVLVVVDGDSARWRTRIIIEAPPPATVEPTELRRELFDRLSGTAASRLGLELAIVALISEQFGGTARLEVEPGRSSTLLLDWPTEVEADPR
ncbi:hypothetical protein BH23PLA1_BH23PLA1_27310 [soil metagenome]